MSLFVVTISQKRKVFNVIFKISRNTEIHGKHCSTEQIQTDLPKTSLFVKEDRITEDLS